MRQGFEKLGLSHQTTTQSQRMNIHTNARLTPRSREALVLAVINRRLTAKAAAVAFAVSERTARKWMARFRAEGMAGLADRCSRPRRSPRQIPPAQIAVVLALRRLRNGACYVSKLFAQSRQALGLRHLFTRPYTPRTNGKAERFIQTSLREWAYARTYQHSTVRAAYLPTSSTTTTGIEHTPLSTTIPPPPNST